MTVPGRSLPAKVAVITLAAATVALTAYHVLAYGYGHYYLREVKQREVEALSTVIEAAIGSVILAEASPDDTYGVALRHLLEHALDSHDLVSVTVWNADGQVLSRQGDPSGTAQAGDPRLLAALEGQETVHFLDAEWQLRGYVPLFAHTLTDATHPIEDIVGALTLLVDMREDVQSFQRALARGGIVSLILFAGISLAVYLFLYALVLRRVTALSALAEQLAQGNLSARSPAQPSSHGDEIDRLHAAFNRMAHEIQHQTRMLADREEHYRSHFELGLIGMVVIDTSGAIREANHAFAEMLGTSIDKLLGKPFAALTHPDDVEESLQQIRAIRENRQDSFTIDKRYIRADESVIFASVAVRAVRKEDGELRYVMALIRDITDQHRAEAALAESEALFRSLAEEALVGIWILQNGRFRFLNQTCSDITGFTCEEMLQWGPDEYLERVHHDDRDRVRQWVDQAQGQTREEAPDTFRCIRSDGELRWITSRSRCLPYRGAPALFGVWLDITDMVRIQHDLQESNARFDSLVRSVPGIIYQFRLEADGRQSLPYIGGGARKTLAPEIQELFQHPEKLVDFIHPDDRTAFNEAFARSRKNLTPYLWEGRMIARDRTWWLLLRSMPERKEDNSIVWNGLLVDMTEKRKTERALREGEARIRAMLDALPDYVFRLNNDGVFLDAHGPDVREDTFQPLELVGRSLYDIDIPRELADHLHDALRKTHAQAQVVTLEASLDDDDGTRIFEVRMARAGEEATVLVARDITRQRQIEEERLHIEEQLQHTQKLESLGVLAGGIAHDFNNLLLAILGNADLALLDLEQDHPVQEHLTDIVTTAQRAAELCSQMLAYSGRGHFVVGPVELNALVREMGHLLEVSISKKVALRYALSEEALHVEVDATQIRQVFMNLITNASEAIGDQPGNITVLTGANACDAPCLDDAYADDDLSPGEYAYFEISDSGTGMDKATQARIFDPFFTTKFTGRGLGLAAVLGIVRGHNGAIRVYSERGRGTTFKVLLPRVAGKEEAPVETQTAPALALGGNPCVLVADDEEHVRRFVQSLLRKVGVKVILADDGREAVQRYEEHQNEIGLVLLDMTMPHLDGAQVLSALRRRNPDVRVILMSGYSEQEVAGQFSGKGLAGFLQKPYRAQDLLQIVRSLLGGETANDH